VKYPIINVSRETLIFSAKHSHKNTKPHKKLIITKIPSSQNKYGTISNNIPRA